MNSRTILAGLLLLVAAATPALAKDGPYVGVSGGLAILHDSDIEISGVGNAKIAYNTGGAFGVSAGYNLGSARLEGEFGYRSADVDKISAGGFSQSVSNMDITVLSYMLNGYYDIKTDSAVTPFIGAGIGVLNGEFSAGGTSDSMNEFGYQFMAGISFKATPNVNLDLSYRYQGAGSDFSKDGTSVSYGSSNLLAGVRLNF